MRRKLGIVMFIGIALVLSIQVKAQSQSRQSAFVDPEIQSIGEGSRKSSECFEMVKVIKREEIDLLHAVTLNDLLLYELNVNQLYTGIDGYRVDYQGFGSRNIRIMQDGHPILPYSADYLDISQITLHHIERVEIFFWANGVSFGNGSISLTINLISRKNEKEHRAGLLQNWNTTNREVKAAGMGFLNYGRHHFRLSAGRNFSDGLEAPNAIRNEVFKPTEQYHAQINYDYKIGDHLEAGVYAGFFLQNLLDRGEPVPQTTRASDRLVRTSRFNAGAYFKQRLSKYHILQVDLSHAALQKNVENQIIDLSSEDVWTINSNDPLDSLSFGQNNVRIELRRLDPKGKFNYQAGVEFNSQRDRRASRDGLDNKSIPQYESFLKAEYRPNDNVWMAAGMRMLYSQRFGSPLNPEARMRLRLSRNFDLLVTLARSYRVPSFNELYYNYTDPNLTIEGNLNLKAEKSYNFFTGFDLHFNKLRFTSNIFVLDKQDAIHLLRTDSIHNVYAFLNTGRNRSFGTQASVTGDFGLLRFQAEASSVGVNAAANLLDQYFFTQQVKANVFLRLMDERLIIGSLNKFTSDNQDLRLNNNGVFEAFQLERYFLSDLSVAYKPGKGDHCIRFAMKNLFDVSTVQGAQFIVDFNSEPEINNYLPGAIARGRMFCIQFEGRW
jgi:outer membrane receptor for ferrienterochelin and colicins